MIKFIFRWAFRMLILAIVVFVGLYLLKDEIARSISESQIRRATGLETRLGAMRVNFTRPVISIQNFTLYNTADFGGGILIDVPDLHIELDPAASSGNLKFKLVRLNVKELNIVESRAGRTNITDLLASLERTQGPASTNRSLPAFKGIDTLNLTMGKVRYLSLRDPRRNQEIPVMLNNDIVLNVRTWSDMGGILFKVLLRAGFSLYLDSRPAVAPTNAPPPVR